jgi:hypothetical protein
MQADFLTKPLQGAFFRKFRDVILLGSQHVDTLREITPSSIEEGVGEKRSTVGVIGNPGYEVSERTTDGGETTAISGFLRTTIATEGAKIKVSWADVVTGRRVLRVGGKSNK